MIQGGDFVNQSGIGGYAYEWHNYCNGQYDPDSLASFDLDCNPENWTLPDEANNGLMHVPYSLSMAKTSNPNTGGSQFFIVDNQSTNWLDGQHTVFGHVVEGHDEIDYISQVSTTTTDSPVDNVTIESIECGFNSASNITGSWSAGGHPLMYRIPLITRNTYTCISFDEIVQDSDGDGVSDSEDQFPNDANETHDDDGDGVGNNADAFPQDENETHDDDGDGVGNNSDAFPQDVNETHDDDGDGVGNNSDAFPQDENETMDTDGDGVGDNSDADPNDPSIRIPADIEINVTDRSLYVLSAAILIFAAVLLFARRKPPSSSPSPFVTEDDSIWND
jgi:cyclophilin family peptidyl-prolyl cis-trans isomerase